MSLLEKSKAPCLPGWTRSKHGDTSCYRLIQSKQNWSDAEKTCEEFGAKLIGIREKYVPDRDYCM